MRTASLRGQGHHFTHVMSRIVQRQFLIKSTEKEKLREIIFKQSAFAGIPVVTWVIVDNHFHLLLEQPDKESLPDLTVDELFKRLPYIYSDEKVKEFKTIFENLEAGGLSLIHI